METKFNFKSAICTSRSQSERLLALGLKRGTADMTIVRVFLGTNEDGTLAFEDVPNAHPPMLRKDIPAWSLHRLLMMLDYDVQTEGRYIALSDYGFAKSDNIYDNLCDCIEWLIKNGYFSKEYLVNLAGTDSHQDMVDSFRYALEAIKEED